jgi:DNA-3-methyladenine glycosylase I
LVDFVVEQLDGCGPIATKRMSGGVGSTHFAGINADMMATPLPDGLWRAPDSRVRCGWCRSDPVYIEYHDAEWGVPGHDDRALFEKICLEGFQSGLSWLTILRKRDNFRRGFADFEIGRVARFTQRDVTRLLKDAGIVRHRGKIESTINNARRCEDLAEEFGSLSNYVWRFEPEARSRPRKLTWKVLKTMATTAESTALSKDLRRRGWTFVGPTTMYAFMQAMGLVNDHLHGCAFRTSKKPAAR